MLSSGLIISWAEIAQNMSPGGLIFNRTMIFTRPNSCNSLYGPRMEPTQNWGAHLASASDSSNITTEMIIFSFCRSWCNNKSDGPRMVVEGTKTHKHTHTLTTCFPIWHLELISKPCQAKCREIKRDITTTMCSVRYDDPNGKSSYLSYHHTLIHVNVRKNALRNISK